MIKICFIAFFAAVSALPVSAQFFYGTDDFNDNSFASGRWNTGTGALSAGVGTGTFTETNSRLELTTSIAATGNTNYSLYRFWANDATGNTSYTDSWVAMVRVTIDPAFLPVSATPNSRGGSTRLGLEVAMAGTNSGYMNIYLTTANLGYNVGTGSGVWNGTSAYTSSSDSFSGGIGNYGPTTDVFLRLSHDGSARTLTSSYSFDSGATYSNLRTLNTDDWLVDPTTGFSLSLFTTNIRYGSPSPSYTVASGQAYLDNFSVSAIPEPSTYAAIFGAGALAFAVWRRRATRPPAAKS